MVRERREEEWNEKKAFFPLIFHTAVEKKSCNILTKMIDARKIFLQDKIKKKAFLETNALQKKKKKFETKQSII